MTTRTALPRTQSSRWWTWLLFVLGCTGFLLIGRHFLLNGRRTPAASKSSPAEEPGTGNQETAAAPPRSSVDRLPAVVTAQRPSPDIQRSYSTEPKLSEPLLVESQGIFAKLYENWVSDEDDLDATADAYAFFDSAFHAYEIHPEAGQVRCGETLCRARFKFSTQKELYKMNQIQEADGVRIATTFPQPDGDGFTVSIYWTRKENPDGPLTLTGGL